MQKIIAAILALLMSLFGSFFPGLIPDDGDPGITQGQWLAALVTEFGMDGDAAAASVDALAKVAADWGIINGAVDLNAKATNAFIANTLKNTIADDLSSLGLINNNKKATQAKAVAWLTAAKDIWANRSFSDTPKADVTTNAAGDLEKVDFEASFAPDLTKAQVLGPDGELIQEAADGAAVAEVNFAKDLLDKGIDLAKGAAKDFLANPKISFSVSGINISAAYTDGRVDIGVGGNVADGVKIEKYYTLSNINVDAKYNANLALLKINEAYVKMDYDLVETTVITGSYAASVVPGAPSDSAADFLTQVKQSLGNLKLVKGGGIKVNIFTFTYPIGPTGIMFEMNVSLTISAVGRIEIIVSSNETKGYEIINNKGRYISETTIVDRLYNISGDFQVVLGLDLGISVFGIKIIDVAFQGGIGAYVLTKIFNKATGEADVIDIPLDIAVEVSTGLDSLANLAFCANVQLYGILRISVGENSILASIGLKKAWTIYDRSNGVFAELHIENTGIVDSCTYAA
ncbi:MAG: hypothetical protein FWF05_01675 [Oscillospiraceae bacterium]|nr:hypothetical protein [Oscillospiraceae bacterium]